MIVEITEDIQTIRSILCHPDIYPLITSSDGPTVDEYEPPFGEVTYIAGMADKVFGLFIIYPCNDNALWCHVQVLPEYRKEYAYRFGMAAIDFAFKVTQARKLMALIPVIYPNVRQFAERCGFEVEGLSKASIRKNGELTDQWLLGRGVI